MFPIVMKLKTKGYPTARIGDTIATLNRFFYYSQGLLFWSS